MHGTHRRECQFQSYVGAPEMNNRMHGRRAISSTLALVLCVVPAVTWAANLIVDGGFEDPVVPVGGFTSVLSGSSFGTGNPWTVIGPAGTSVSPISRAYRVGGL